MATREKIKLTSYNELLGVNNDMISEIDINKLHQFKDHPFSVVDNEKMFELAKSIENNGILSPLLVRPLGNGEDTEEREPVKLQERKKFQQL